MEREIHVYFSTKSGNISHILKAFFVRHSSEYETSDSDRKVAQNYIARFSYSDECRTEKAFSM